MQKAVFQPAGNYYDKYSSRNPIVRLLMNGFISSFDRLVSQTGAQTVHEIGCGEGHLTLRLASRGLQVRGTDIAPAAIEMAQTVATAKGLSIPFSSGNIYDLTPSRDAAELIVCCEVLEHLDDTSRALDILASLAKPYLLVSVPREPIWRMLNLCRGRYMTDLGNTPGHVQHWSAKGFVNLLQGRFELIHVEKPLPWTMALCRVGR